ncbi:MAG: cupin-like domain-containing protein [Taibaiella sp.]|nr:cupin-like domain-containing protein [Taibaiella sp.]
MDVQRVGDISQKEFVENFYKPGIPVVFTNASKVWKANGTFTPDWFRKNYGDRTTELNGKRYTMTEILNLVETSTVEKPAPYPFIFDINKQLPELLPMVQPLNMNYAVPNWLENKWFSRGYWGSATEIFIGGPGGRFPYVHIDYFHLNAWINQLYGEKQFIVFPKGQDEFLYPKPNDQWQSEVNIFNPDYTKHPKFKHATPVKFTVGAGESLFIPFGTWHSAYSLTPTISVAFDQLNSKNYPEFIKDVWSFKKREGMLKAIAMYGYAKFAGRMSMMSDTL